jgi:hypothetical protein
MLIAVLKLKKPDRLSRKKTSDDPNSESRPIVSNCRKLGSAIKAYFSQMRSTVRIVMRFFLVVR